MALRWINNLCIAATKATFLGLPRGHQVPVEGSDHGMGPGRRP